MTEENNINLTKFTKNLEEILMFFNSKKIRIVEFLKKNFRENIHFIKLKSTQKEQGSGGHNKINYFLTEETYELIKNSFNLKHRYVTKNQ
jgi:hypothetical protein